MTAPTESAFEDLDERTLADRIEQVVEVLRARCGDPAVFSIGTIRYHLRRGKSPLQIADLLLPRPSPDAHLGGRDA